MLHPIWVIFDDLGSNHYFRADLDLQDQAGTGRQALVQPAHPFWEVRKNKCALDQALPASPWPDTSQVLSIQ